MMMGYGSPMGDPHHRRVTLLTFKQFLVQQDDNINDQEAFRMYQEYKTDFKKKQVQQFFNDHKEEDWSVLLYQIEVFVVVCSDMVTLRKITDIALA